MIRCVTRCQFVNILYTCGNKIICMIRRKCLHSNPFTHFMSLQGHKLFTLLVDFNQCLHALMLDGGWKIWQWSKNQNALWAVICESLFPFTQTCVEIFKLENVESNRSLRHTTINHILNFLNDFYTLKLFLSKDLAFLRLSTNRNPDQWWRK